MPTVASCWSALPRDRSVLGVSLGSSPQDARNIGEYMLIYASEDGYEESKSAAYLNALLAA